MATVKKRTVEEDCHPFKEKWTNKYFCPWFVNKVNGKTHSNIDRQPDHGWTLIQSQSLWRSLVVTAELLAQSNYALCVNIAFSYSAKTKANYDFWIQWWVCKTLTAFGESYQEMKSKQKEMDGFSTMFNVNQLVFLINLQDVMAPVFTYSLIFCITVGAWQRSLTERCLRPWVLQWSGQVLCFRVFFKSHLQHLQHTFICWFI